MKASSSVAYIFAALAPFAYAVPAQANEPLSSANKATLILAGKSIQLPACARNNFFQMIKNYPRFRTCDGYNPSQLGQIYTSFNDRFLTNTTSTLIGLSSGGLGLREPDASYNWQFNFMMSSGKLHSENILMEAATVCAWHNLFQSQLRTPVYVQCLAKNTSRKLSHKESYGMYSEADHFKNQDPKAEAQREAKPRLAPNYLAVLEGTEGAVKITKRLNGIPYTRTACEWHNFNNSFHPLPYYAKCKGDKDLATSVGRYKGYKNFKLLSANNRIKNGTARYDFEQRVGVDIGKEHIEIKKCEIHNYLESNMRRPYYVKCNSVEVIDLPLDTFPKADKRFTYNNNYTN